MHHLAKAFQLGEIKPFSDGLFKRCPGAAEPSAEDAPGMASYLRDSQGRNKLVRAGSFSDYSCFITSILIFDCF